VSLSLSASFQEELLGQLCQTLVAHHILGLTCQVAKPLLAKVKHWIAHSLTRKLGELWTEVKSAHWSSHIDCKVQARENTVLVLAAAVAVAAGVEDSAPCRLM
jgi:hypothetical protein